MSFPVSLRCGSTSESFQVHGKWPDAKFLQAGYDHRCWHWVEGTGLFTWRLNESVDFFTRELSKFIYALILVLNFVSIFDSGSNDTKVMPNNSDLATKKSTHVISQSAVITIVRKTKVIFQRKECFHSSEQFPLIAAVFINKVRVKIFPRFIDGSVT